MQKILIDTDPGQDIDDLLAILFALRRPELDVRAITTATFPTDGRARLVKRLLRYLDRTDIPVAAGMNYPFRILGDAEQKMLNHPGSSMNHRSFAEPHDPRDDPGAADAVDLIIRTVDAHAGEIALACIAPLTNIATAFCKRPDLPAKIKYIALMGGEINSVRAEHNIAFDPVSADIVLSAGVPTYMGTWSVTRQLQFTMEDCRTTFGAHNSPLVQALWQAITAWHPAQGWKPGPVMYDLFPMVWAFDRTLYTVAQKAVRVEIHGEHTRGVTIPGGTATHIHVTTDANIPALRKLFLDTVLQ